MSLLHQLGWNSFHSETYAQYTEKGVSPGRVVSIKGTSHTVIAERGELDCEISGRLLFTSDPEDLPKVGDWITFLDYGETGVITSVLPRKTILARKKPGHSSERQILATNIDGALIVQSLDSNFNLMRLERYIVQVLACDIVPIVLLNKSDLIEDRKVFDEQIASLNRDVAIVYCSTLSGEGLPEIRAALKEFRTYILIGSSGVGKSSLLNELLSTQVRATGSISESNLKGRHTTTSRDLYPLGNGSLIIDTPGMREFGVTYEDAAVGDLFPVIGALAVHCRFPDCSHVNEPGCAVLAALQEGRVTAEVYDSYIKLMKEQRRFQIRTEDKKRLNRQFGKLTREAKLHRRRNKF